MRAPEDARAFPFSHVIFILHLSGLNLGGMGLTFDDYTRLRERDVLFEEQTHGEEGDTSLFGSWQLGRLVEYQLV